MKPRIGGTKPKWKPKRAVHHDRVIDKVVVHGFQNIGHGEVWDHTFYIEKWGPYLMATNDYTDKGCAKVYSEQIFNVEQRYNETKKEFEYFYLPARNAVGPRRLRLMEDLLNYRPWENFTIADSFAEKEFNGP